MYDEPPYQRGIVLGEQRGVPDVSYSAATYHGVLVYFYGIWYLFGGTSAGSPQWAAFLAIADQKAGHDLGFINTALYKIGLSQRIYAAAFYDVKSGNNSVTYPVDITGFEAGSGWDATTGLGSPRASKLVLNLIKLVKPEDGLNVIQSSVPNLKGRSSSVPGHVQPH